MKNITYIFVLFCGILIQAQSLTQLEYAFDQMNGTSNGTIELPGNVDNAQITIPTHDLTPGTHIAFFRVKDSQNQWSNYHSAVFTLGGEGSDNPQITQLEYFVGDDPGVGQATAIDLGDAQPFEADVQIPLTQEEVDLLDENPYVYFRIRESSNFWSQTNFLEVDPEMLSISNVSGVAEDIQMYPNPVHQYLNINLKDMNGNVSVEVFDATGKIIIQKSLKEMNNQLTFSNLPSGVYFLNITQNGQVVKQAKIMKK